MEFRNAARESHACHQVEIGSYKVDDFGLSALGLFVRLWTRTREPGERMAFYNPDEHEIAFLKVVWLNEFWAICDSRNP